LIEAKRRDGKPVDPVARFHLGNGARLERLNWMADPSPKSLSEAFGLMVNYRYDLKEIEKNHEALADEGTVAASRAVRSLLRPLTKAKPAVVLVPGRLWRCRRRFRPRALPDWPPNRLLSPQVIRAQYR